ncbi:class I SAM-dependent methyltransferase [Haladaptatus sp. NG-SE-30]
MTRFQNTGQPDWDWWGQLWPEPSDLLQTLGVVSGETVAEIGCGNGYFVIPAAERAEAVYAIDMDDELLAELTDIAEERDVTDQIETICGDARNLSTLLPDTVSFALVANILHGVAEKESFLREVRRGLQPAGRIAVINWHDRPRTETTLDGEPRGPPTDLRMSLDETKAVLEESGFSIEETVDLPPFHYALVAERSEHSD